MPEQLTLAGLEAQALEDLNAHEEPPELPLLRRLLAQWNGKTPAEYHDELDDTSSDPLGDYDA